MEQNETLYMALISDLAKYGDGASLLEALEPKYQHSQLELNECLLEATIRGMKIVVEKLLSRGADVNYGNSKNFSALHCAIAYGHPDLMRLLLNQGADPVKSLGKNSSPMVYAIARADLEMVEILYRAGVDLNKSPGTDAPYLGGAIIHYNYAITAFLLNNGALPNRVLVQ